MPSLDLLFELTDFGLHLLQLVNQRLKRTMDQDRQVFLDIIFHQSDELRQSGSLLCRNDTKLGKVASKRIDQHRTLLNQEVSAFVKSEHRLLINRFDRHETHRWSCRSLADCR